MIAVIADDFTGAAELAGISLRYGLSVEVFLHEIDNASGDVAIVCTDSRSMRLQDALNATESAINNVLRLTTTLVYKKIDSVLRGYVIEEVKIQMRILGNNKALICPANPSLKRTINNGEYLIDQKPITTTDFTKDPEFPISNASVVKMLNNDSVQVLKHTDVLPEQGIIIAEATNAEDVSKWAKKISNSWVLAGAGDFYAALLEKKYKHQEQEKYRISLSHLYICGTALNQRKAFVKKSGCVAYLPDQLTEDWITDAVSIIQQQQKLIIAIENSEMAAAQLRTLMARAVNEIIKVSGVNEIFIEGGSTAAAVLKELNINQLTPVNELQRGVVRMKANDLFITVKPGSYRLPEEIIELYK